MTTNTQWRPISIPPQPALAEARVQVHYAVQLLASFGQTLAAPADDDSHRSMSWDGKAGAFRSAPAAGSRELTAFVSPAPFEVRVQGERDATLTLSGTTIAEAYAWLEEAVETELGRPDYEIPAHALASGARFGADPDALAELERWYGNAAHVLQTVYAENEEAGAIRCWPHHFDLATLLEFPASEDGTARSVGVGFSPGDASYPGPYGYVTPWPYDFDAARADLPAGHWHTEGWLGAVLTAEEWKTPAVVEAYYRAAVGASKAILGL